MNHGIVEIKRALISVSNKDGVVDFAKSLQELGVEIISTGGTARALRETGIPVKDVSEFTGFPEMMEGRVKTLHPKVHGGILGRRDRDTEIAATHGIEWIDLVVCNLYPFAETIEKPNVSFDEVIENIDIGGPTMIRSAAKNMGWVTVLIDPTDYTPLLKELKSGGVSFETRKRLATKAFGHTGAYDSIIYNYLSEEKFPENYFINYKKLFDLRYGENPHQRAAAYLKSSPPYEACLPARQGGPGGSRGGVLSATKLQGKELSYNNLNDADGALACLREFTEPACVIVKHANPCGVASGHDITEIFKRAYSADSLAAFGGIIALNRTCTKEIAEYIGTVFTEIVMAPSFATEALNLFAVKKNLRVLELKSIEVPLAHVEIRQVADGLLVQDADVREVKKEELKCVTAKQPTDLEYADMLFGWKVLKHMKSNAILLAKYATTVGIGPGQVSRVDAVETAIKKAGPRAAGSILASDAFFPFRDSIDKIAPTGITALIQPGGSIKDQEVIEACNEHGIAMVFTGVRCFKH